MVLFMFLFDYTRAAATTFCFRSQSKNSAALRRRTFRFSDFEQIDQCDRGPKKF